MPWTEKPPLKHPRAGLAACAASTPGAGTWIYALGGFDGNQHVATVEAYDTAKQTWAQTPSMPTERAYLAAASVGGLVHAIGGSDNTASMNFTEHDAYNPATNTWSARAPMLTGRIAHSAVTGSDGLVYAMGGITASNAVVSTVEAFDPATDKWTTKASMGTPRATFAAVALPGRIYAIGGCNQSPTDMKPVILNSVEYYDIAKGTWTPATPLPVATKYGAAAVSPSGVIILMGGWDTVADYDSSVWGFDPSVNSWRRQASLLNGGTGALAAATGPDGLIYAIGGAAPPAGTLAVSGDVEAYAYDKCDYIEDEIHAVEQKIAALESDIGDLTPQQLAGVRKQLAVLQQELLTLENQLKLCRG